MPAYSQLVGSEFLKVIDEFMEYYHGFPWESRIWAACGHRRSPYRVLVLFGLSSRTKDHLLVETCRLFFQRFPNPRALIKDWAGHRTAIGDMVRKGQVPFVESAVSTLRERDGMVPQERASLLKIRGVGDKIAECVLGYGWGCEALPMDGNGCRVVERLVGVTPLTQNHDVAEIRNALKATFSNHRDWMANRSMAMIDVHEVLRLHGQAVCKKSPLCSRCPVSGCRSRNREYSGSAGGGVTADLWEAWRELILTPPTLESAIKRRKAGQKSGGTEPI